MDKRGENRKREEKTRRFHPSDLWSAAKCTDQSDGNTQSVHLFEPAGHRYLSQPGLHPQTHPRTHTQEGEGRGGVWLLRE